MKIGLPVIVAIAGILGAALGVGGRIALSPGAESPPASVKDPGDAKSDAAAAQVSPHQSAAADEKGHRGAEKHDKSHKEQHVQAGSYFKFSRQFVAPVVRDGGPEALIVLDVVLELSPESAEAYYSIEPKLRDAVLRALLTQSGKGELKGMLSDPALLEATREAILTNVQGIIGDNARSILLLDVAYQPF